MTREDCNTWPDWISGMGLHGDIIRQINNKRVVHRWVVVQLCTPSFANISKVNPKVASPAGENCNL